MCRGDRALIELILASGLRLSEIAQLNRKSIVIERTVADKSVLGVGEVIGKGGKSRTFYVHENALRAVFQYEQARKDKGDALFISERMLRMSKRAMQERFSPRIARVSRGYCQLEACGCQEACLRGSGFGPAESGTRSWHQASQRRKATGLPGR